jgi:hypothetical protein
VLEKDLTAQAKLAMAALGPYVLGKLALLFDAMSRFIYV